MTLSVTATTAAASEDGSASSDDGALSTTVGGPETASIPTVTRSPEDGRVRETARECPLATPGDRPRGGEVETIVEEEP